MFSQSFLTKIIYSIYLFVFMLQYAGANIQLLDLPGIIEGAAQGKGRGRQVIAVARTADLIIIMLDAMKGEIQK
jgi:ribosome-interacting GTPase 1